MKKDERMDALKLENQLCFPLYAASREIVKKYTPFLKEIDLTYTQYLVMMVLWEVKEIGVKSLGEVLYLDSGTITPVVKKLEQMGLVERRRGVSDERTMKVILTNRGEALKEKAVTIPERMSQCLNLDGKEAAILYKLLHKLLPKAGE